MENMKQFILQLSAQSGEYLRNHFYTFKNVYQKDIGKLVTNIDLELEEIITKRIQQEFPDHGIIFIGSKKIHEDAKNLWIIDALDGSSHFSRGIPMYTVNIAFQKNGETLLGTVNSPQTHQLFFAQKGEGAKLNGIDINVSAQNDMSKAYIYIELPEKKFTAQQGVEQKFDTNMKRVQELVKNAGQVETFRIGAFGQCMVASGAFDAYVDLSGSSEKLSQQASQLIVQEAGGKIINIEQPQNGFIQIMATNGRLKDDLRQLITEERKNRET